MDRMRIESHRRNLELKTTEELRDALETSAQAGAPPEEVAAIREILARRQHGSSRMGFALGTALVIGVLASLGVWAQGGEQHFVVLAGLGSALLGFGSWYVPDLIPRS